MKELYLDANATTRVNNEVVKTISDCMLNNYGNPSSEHRLGDNSSKKVLESRSFIARTIGCKAQEIFFTSGATESNNWIFTGLAHLNPNKKKVLISSIEHSSINETANLFVNWGYNIVRIPVDKKGFVDLEFLKNNIDNETLFVSIIHGNNIFGTIQNLKKIGDICKKNNVLFHTDAAQTLGKVKILVHDWNIGLLSGSAHKLEGPKGVGFLYVREGTKFSPLIYGGGQEKGLRSGTENVPGIVGFSKALEISIKRDWNKIKQIRDYLIEELEKINCKIIGSKEERIPNNIFITIPNVNGEKLIYDLSGKGIYVSKGSACDSKKELEENSIKELGLSDKEIKSSIRISLPSYIKKKDIDYFLKMLKSLI
jgi:cysteine desulfurase